jgi:hypothetical protein
MSDAFLALRVVLQAAEGSGQMQRASGSGRQFSPTEYERRVGSKQHMHLRES